MKLKNAKTVENLTKIFNLYRITYGDGLVDRIEVLEPFFSIEHNGLIYAYNLPSHITSKIFHPPSLPQAFHISAVPAHYNSKSPDYSRITVNVVIPEAEANRFNDCFFMIQALEVVNRVAQPMASNEKPKDPRADDIAAQVARRKAELVLAEAKKQREWELEEEARDARVRDIVADVQKNVNNRKQNSTTTISSSSTQRQNLHAVNMDDVSVIKVSETFPRIEPPFSYLPNNSVSKCNQEKVVYRLQKTQPVSSNGRQQLPDYHQPAAPSKLPKANKTKTE
uniref:Uncharacterized protein n=1 Tax=Caenorhabditis japonica TaxID=281687 RepID=A0A8R1ESN9_CAEJA